MKYLKIIKYKPRQIKSWQILAVVGKTKSQVEKRTKKSIKASFRFDKFSYEFKDYQTVKISDKKADIIKKGSKSDVKQIALNVVSNSKSNIINTPEKIVF